MSIPCPRCGAQYDVTLFAFGRTVRCSCGLVVDAARPVEGGIAGGAREREDSRAAELRRRADRITWTVLYSDLPRVDVEIQIESLREWVRAHLPDRLPLFEMVYEARWRRLAEQGWERPRPEA